MKNLRAGVWGSDERGGRESGDESVGKTEGGGEECGHRRERGGVGE